jgi:transporter family protein
MMWWVYALVSGSGAAFIALLVKLGLRSIDSYMLTFWFSFFSVIALGVMGIVTKRLSLGSIAAVSTQEWFYVVAIAIINAIAFFSYFIALRTGPLCVALAVDRLSILYVVILSALFLGQKFTVTSLCGALMMFGGVFLLTC